MMGATSAIEWTEATWNPLVGCTKVSPGCDHCYAETLVNRFAGKNKGFPNRFDVVTIRDDKMLTQPLRWRQPKRIFVNSLSDLFHKDVPDSFIARVLAVIALTPQHSYQLLTKRHGRMNSLLGSERIKEGVANQMALLITDRPGAYDLPWPLPNLWLGVSVEDQQWADIRIPALLDTPAAVRFLSCEPLLGPVDLFNGVFTEDDGQRPGPAVVSEGYSIRTDYGTGVEYDVQHEPGIDWVIVGGESGPGSRPMHPDWARSLRDQCVAAGVPFLFKQWGEYEPSGAGIGRLVHPRFAYVGEPDEHGWRQTMERVGKKAAGRELDGRTWDEYPAAVAS